MEYINDNTPQFHKTEINNELICKRKFESNKRNCKNVKPDQIFV